jgi:hypothetical protein
MHRTTRCRKKEKVYQNVLLRLIINYLKIVKRKLKTVDSFRDEKMTKLTFQWMVNVRNFVPFMSGSKNDHKSPFELAGGETYGLSWIQTMKVHNM